MRCSRRHSQVHAPGSAAHRAYAQFNGANPATPNGDLTSRLFSLSSNGRVDAWHIALDMARAEPLRGLGAGSYEASWLLHRPEPLQLVDAHNVYLETLAELGAVGLALLLLVFLTPLAVLRSRRAEPLAASVAGASVVFLAHGLVDWDWEIPAVTLAGLFCGLALAVVRTDGRQVRLPKLLVLGAVVPLAVLAVFVQLGWSNLAAAQADLAAGHWQAAERKAKQAHRWQPWSSEPWTARGDARLEAGDYRGARNAYARATKATPGDWHGWYDLALVSRGTERKRAIARAQRLNPIGGESAGLASAPAVAH